MGEVVKAECACGYNQQVSIGGTQYGKGWTFPHHCKNCGLVNVEMANTAPRSCPHCNATDIQEYGYTTIKQTFLDKLLGRHRKSHSQASNPIGNPTAQCWDHHLTNEQNLCPSCGGMTLRFTETGYYFD